MENKGLIFIPDISGYTNFVNKLEIEHSRLIMEELLELIINANELGLGISEIEGHAILFYKFGEPPELESLYKQVEKMFCDFHRHLLTYDVSKYCQCSACMSAIDLTLKIITHYGEFTGLNVRNFNKLIGKDVIIAHQLLKNDIEQHEYWLVTPQLADSPLPGFKQWMKWDSSTKLTEQGKVPFYYTMLTELKEQITNPPVYDPILDDKSKVISSSRDYDADIITLFHAAGEFKFRHLWFQGVKKMEKVSHYLPRVGMQCSCITEDGQENIFSSSYYYSPDKIVFSETSEDKKNTTFYTLEKVGDNTRLTLDYYIDKNEANQTEFELTQKNKIQKIFETSLSNLAEFLKDFSF